MAIVVSHIGAEFEPLARQALRQAPLADLIEVRLDHIGHPGEERLRELVERAKKPVIIAMHGPESQGHYTGDLGRKLETLHAAARAGAMFVDIDWRLSLELGPLEGKCHRIVSRHEAEGTPEDLAALEEDVRAVLHEGDAVKLVTHARCAEDGLRMLRHLRSARGGLVAFCSGPRGSFTRVLCTLFGSPFTYAAAARIPGQPDPEPTAPGQLRANDLRGLLPPGGLHPGTAVFAVVGGAVEHSLSPHVHDMALKMARLDAVYLALSAQSLERVVELADDACFRGFSVTAPHKQAAFGLARSSDAESRAARASNTLVRDGTGWRAANTDVPAVRETLEKAWGFHRQRSGKPFLAQGAGLAGVHALVLGAGGAARAVVQAVKASGGRATLAARAPEKARAVAAELGCAAVAWSAIPQTEHDVLVNATPLGGRGRPADEPASPVPAEWVRAGTLVLDAVYDPVRTALLEAARARGCTPVPGAEWFVRQAAAQFQQFTQQAADESVLRSALEKALGAGR